MNVVWMRQDVYPVFALFNRLIQKALLMLLVASAQFDIIVYLLLLKPLRCVDLVDRIAERMDRSIGRHLQELARDDLMNTDVVLLTVAYDRYFTIRGAV